MGWLRLVGSLKLWVSFAEYRLFYRALLQTCVGHSFSHLIWHMRVKHHFTSEDEIHRLSTLCIFVIKKHFLKRTVTLEDMAHVLNKYRLRGHTTHCNTHTYLGDTCTTAPCYNTLQHVSHTSVWHMSHSSHICLTHEKHFYIGIYDSSSSAQSHWNIWLICQQSHLNIRLICQTDMTRLSNWYDSSVKLIWHSCQSCQTDKTHLSTKSHRKIWLITQTDVQPIADRVAQNLEIISKNFRFSTRRTKILMGLIIYYLILIVNPMGRILVLEKV